MASSSKSRDIPIGITRNLTEVFLLLRSNAQQSKFVYLDDASTVVRGNKDEEKMNLIQLEDGKADEEQPFWIHTADEVEYEFERVRTRIEELSNSQRKHISRPNFGDELFEEEEKQMELSTEQITQMLTHCQRLIRMMSSQNNRSETMTQRKLRENSANTLNLTLSQLTDNFRTRQVKYLHDIQNRSRNVDNFLITSGTGLDEPNWGELVDVSPSNEYTMTQLQQFMNNDKEVREREKEVLAVNSSIRELNTLFKDLSNMVIDQGTILDRIDYNVEQSSIRVSRAVENVSKAEAHQRNDKKMHCICMLTVAIIFVLILLIATKF